MKNLTDAHLQKNKNYQSGQKISMVQRKLLMIGKCGGMAIILTS